MWNTLHRTKMRRSKIFEMNTVFFGCNLNKIRANKCEKEIHKVEGMRGCIHFIEMFNDKFALLLLLHVVYTRWGSDRMRCSMLKLFWKIRHWKLCILKTLMCLYSATSKYIRSLYVGGLDVCVLLVGCHAYCNSCRLCFVYYIQSRVHKYAFHDSSAYSGVYIQNRAHRMNVFRGLYVCAMRCMYIIANQYNLSHTHICFNIHQHRYSLTRNKTHSKTVYLICVHLS